VFSNDVVQHDQAARLARIQTTRTAGVHTDLRRVAGCATSTGFAGHPGAMASLKLTFEVGHSAGANQCEESDAGAVMASFASIPILADYLVRGYWTWSGVQGAQPRHWTSSNVSVNITDLAPAEQALAISALNAWHEVANISFEFTSGPAQITYNNNGSRIAGTSLTVSGTALTSATIQISSDWWPNYNIYSYMYQT
jgi:serralysin